VVLVVEVSITKRSIKYMRKVVAAVVSIAVVVAAVYGSATAAAAAMWSPVRATYQRKEAPRVPNIPRKLTSPLLELKLRHLQCPAISPERTEDMITTNALAAPACQRGDLRLCCRYVASFIFCTDSFLGSISELFK
jgi:hypothetical protein